MKYKFFIIPKSHPSSTVGTVTVILLFGALTGSAQTGDYLYSGSEQTITLGSGLYDITAYGAQGGEGYAYVGGLGAEMEGEFSFSGLTTLTLLVGGIGGFGLEAGGGGGGGSFVVNGSTPLVIAGGGGSSNSGEPGGPGGGGGSYIDSSAIAILTEVSGVASPDGSPNGEIIITSVPEPGEFALISLGALLLAWRRWKKA